MISWTHEKTVGKDTDINHKCRRKIKPASPCDAHAESHRCKQHAPKTDGEIPVTAHENVSPWAPHVVGRHPHPVGPHHRPIAGTPSIGIIVPYPAAGYPGVIGRRRIDIGPPARRIRGVRADRSWRYCTRAPNSQKSIDSRLRQAPNSPESIAGPGGTTRQVPLIQMKSFRSPSQPQ